MEAFIAVDIETRCKLGCTTKCKHPLLPHTAEIDLIGVWSPWVAKVFTDLDEFLSWLESKKVYVVGHNFKFDLNHILYHRPEAKSFLVKRWKYDTALLASLYPHTEAYQHYLERYEETRKEINKRLKKQGLMHGHRHARRLSLKTLAPFFLNVKPFWENPETYNDPEYCLKDCEYTYKLAEYFIKHLPPKALSFYLNKLHPYSLMVLEMELRGVYIDREKLLVQKRIYEAKVKELEEKLAKEFKKELSEWEKRRNDSIRKRYDYLCTQQIKKGRDVEKTKARYEILCKEAIKKAPGFKFSSTQQLIKLLKWRGFDVHSLEGKEAADKEVLNRLAERHPEVKLILEYRKVSKILTAFINPYLELFLRDDNTIHSTFKLHGTRTGRLSSSDPNLQQVPSELRQIFKPRPGYKFVCRDVQNIEPFLAAYASKDPNLCRIIANGWSFHNVNTCVFFDKDLEKHPEAKELWPNERKFSKSLGLAILYGCGVNGIVKNAQKFGYSWSREKAKKLYENFKNHYQKVFQFKERLQDLFLQHKATNLFGRPIYCLEDEVWHKSLNTFIQSSASDLVLHTAFHIYNVFKLKGIDGYPILLVHDEVVFEVNEKDLPQAIEIIDKSFEYYKLTSPEGLLELKTTGSVGDAWDK